MKEHCDVTEDLSLEKTVYNLTPKAILNTAGILIIFLYWIVFFWENSMADYGNYDIFPYGLHEIWGIGTFIVPLFTFIWMASVVAKNIIRKTITKNIILIIFLAILFAGQCGWIHWSNYYVTMTCFATIKDIGAENFTVYTPEGVKVINCDRRITKLLLDDGTEYLVEFRWNTLKPNSAKLLTIELSDND